jgi:hypothetical protein
MALVQFSLYGALYFGLVLALSLKFKFKLKHGLWLPMSVALFFALMMVTAGSQDPTGWVALGYFVGVLIALSVLLSYLVLWGVWTLYLRLRAQR